jgi:hypothetical protein
MFTLGGDWNNVNTPEDSSFQPFVTNTRPISDKVSGDIINAITKFQFVQNVGEYGLSAILPE